MIIEPIGYCNPAYAHMNGQKISVDPNALMIPIIFRIHRSWLGHYMRNLTNCVEVNVLDTDLSLQASEVGVSITTSGHFP
jgi:hypothetical protein